MSAGCDTDVAIVGGGVAGLTVARDLAAAGVGVVLCEASSEVGGLLRRGVVAGRDVDLGAESFATRTDAVAELAAELGLPTVTPRAGGAWIAVATEDGPRRLPLPQRTIVGIPADPRAADVVAIIGADAAATAAGEPLLPVSGDDVSDDAAREPSLHDLVERRLGPLVARRLVDPLCRSVYSRPASDVRLSQVNPALWREFAARGSLVDAVAALLRARSDRGVRAGAAVAGIAGGMWRLPQALAAAAAAHGADLRTGVAVTAVEPATGPATDGVVVVHTTAGPLRARRVVVATGPAATASLLGVPALALPAVSAVLASASSVLTAVSASAHRGRGEVGANGGVGVPLGPDCANSTPGGRVAGGEVGAIGGVGVPLGPDCANFAGGDGGGRGAHGECGTPGGCGEVDANGGVGAPLGPDCASFAGGHGGGRGTHGECSTPGGRGEVGANGGVGVPLGPDCADFAGGVASGDSQNEPGRIRVVVAAIAHPGLDAFPVGAGVIVDPALDTAAKALTHVTAKWEWAGAAARGIHLVRLSARDADAGTLATAADVARETSLLTGVDLAPEDVRDLVVHEWTDAVALGPLPGATLGRLAQSGIELTGAVVAGTGLAAVVPHARALAARLGGELVGPSPSSTSRQRSIA
ncbi:protoporphyrinogen/coproporphyrinogen oxidase [Microbacterium sp.]|uniref:protoporphyrinogen/coproporphyrinogen oxidase n=1 Tax=Microbacterium sp. TaxID=51671 RepID=UPI0039E589E1